MAMTPILITQGTQTAVQADLNGTVAYPVMKLDMGVAGGSNLFTGTILAVTNIAGRTITALGAGTTNVGTVDSVSQLPPNYFNTTVTSGTSTLGTIKPAVAGSAIFVTDLIISVGTQTTLVIGMGGTSTPLIGTLSLAQYGGLVSNFRVPGSVTSGSALVYQQSANNTLSITAMGFVR
jgi:hypothetical protein